MTRVESSRLHFNEAGTRFSINARLSCLPLETQRCWRAWGSPGTDPGSSREWESVKRQVSRGLVSYMSVMMLSSVQEKRGTPAMG